MTAPSNIGKSLASSSAGSFSINATSTISPSGGNFEPSRRQSSFQQGNSFSTSAQTHSNAKKGQGQRKQHRNHRRANPNDDDDDMANVRTYGNGTSRRGQTSITHLMNYHMSTRSYLEAAQQQHNAYSQNRSYRRNPTWGVGSGYHSADKARYVNANYRFVVNPRGDYAKQAVDPDENIEWADVLQVLVSAESQAASCPICLEDVPVAPRMAKCGHMFCLPCLIRFMNSTSEDDVMKPGFERRIKWKKCPICEDTIYMMDVRPVRMYAAQESRLPTPGDDVILRLMGRFANSTLALPKAGGFEDVARDEIPWHFAANVLDYARIMRGTSGYMNEEYDRETVELAAQEKSDELLFHENGEWTQRAVNSINAAKDKLKDLGDVQAALSDATKTSKSQSRNAEPDFFFYTSPPHLYLSPLDIRILKTKYGNFSQFPSTLLPRLEHISTGHSVDDAMRRRAKYLGHLPQGCLVSFIECDWTDIIPPETLDTFKDEIERRRKRNHDKEWQEERERQDAERVESAAYRRIPVKRNLSAALEDGSIIVGGSGGGGGGGGISDASYSSSGLHDSEYYPLGASPPAIRSGYTQLASMSTSPSAQRTVWGTPAAAALSDTPEMEATEPLEEVDDGWLRDDAFLGSMEDADIALQMEALGVDTSPYKNKGVAPAAAEPVANSGGGGKKGKKQKQKKITLMSTGGRRGL